MNTNIINKSELRILNNRRRRNRQLKRRITIFTASLILLLSVFAIFKCASANASTNDSEILYKYYMSVEVAYGDNLYDIASKYMTASKYSTDQFIEEVKHMNNLDEEGHIVSGNYIIVPYYDVFHG